MGRYRRNVSFPDPIPISRSRGLHVRSASLPCSRSNPLIPQVRDEINELRSINSSNRAGLGWVCDGLTRMKGVLDSLDDVLQLPQTMDSLSYSTSFIEKLLEDFLSFVDAYGIFQASLLGLKQELAEAQVAIRRKDVQKLGLHVKAQKKIANEISRLVGSITITQQPSISVVDDDEELHLVICDVLRLMVSVSVGLFGGVSTSFGLGRRPGWAWLGLSRWGRKEEEFEEVIEGVERLMGLKKKGKEKKCEEIKKGLLKRMQEMEDCVGEMERGSERVLRSLISTRVSLLNLLTHA